MKPNRIYRKMEWTEEQRKAHAEIRERFQREKPTREELLASGDLVEFGTMGELVDTLVAARTLATLREKAGLSIEEAARSAGTTVDAWQAVERGDWVGKVDLELLYRCAHAVGAELRFVVQSASAGKTE